MKAVQASHYGGAEIFEVKDVAEPAVSDTTVLVNVHAASLNPFDLFLFSGVAKDKTPLPFPCTPGGDFSGTVVALGKDVTGYSVGDEVYGTALILTGGSGSMAERAVVNPDRMAPKPKNVNVIEAAALPLVGSSAVQAIEEHIKLTAGQKILIHGGAGGIGHIAIQIAKALGAFVATTAGKNDFEFIKSLGADQVIDYKTERFDELLSGFDAVYDTIGGEVTERSFTVLKKGGVLLSMKGQPDPARASSLGVIAIGQNTKTNTAHLQRLAEFVESGKVHVHIEKTFPLEDVQSAWRAQSEHHRGKIIITIET